MSTSWGIGEHKSGKYLSYSKAKRSVIATNKLVIIYSAEFVLGRMLNLMKKSEHFIPCKRSKFIKEAISFHEACSFILTKSTPVYVFWCSVYKHCFPHFFSSYSDRRAFVNASH